MIEAVHVEKINGRQVHFFASAAAGDDPWISWPDLMAACGFSFIKRAGKTRLLRKHHAGSIVEATTPQGRVLIVPAYMAKAILWIEERDKHIPPGVEAEFVGATLIAARAANDSNILAAMPAAGSA